MEISQEYRKGIMFVRVVGRIDKNTSFELKYKIDELKEEFNNIVINLDYVTNIDLKGINTLYYIYELTYRKNNNILLCLNNGKIKQILSKYRIFNYIHQIDNELNAFDVITV